MLGGPPPTIIQAEASIRDASGNLQDFWLVSFTDNSGTAFTKPPPASFDLSLFPQGGGLLFINEANPNLPSFSGPIDSLVGTAVATPEPSTLTLLGLGSLGLLGYGGRRWKRAVA